VEVGGIEGRIVCTGLGDALGDDADARRQTQPGGKFDAWNEA
jgi:hypothetical protein